MQDLTILLISLSFIIIIKKIAHYINIQQTKQFHIYLKNTHKYEEENQIDRIATQ